MADTGFKNPSANAIDAGAGFVGPADAYTLNTVYAAASNLNDAHRYYNYAFGIPAGSSNFFIEVELDANAQGTIVLNGDFARLAIDISIDGGTNWSAVKNANWVPDGFDAQVLLGGATDNWGLTLTESSFSDANFRIRAKLSQLTGGATGILLDWIGVKVYYTPGGSARKRIYIT